MTLDILYRIIVLVFRKKNRIITEYYVHGFTWVQQNLVN